MSHNFPPIERRHHAFHIRRDGTWIDVATGQPYDGPYKTDLSQIPASEWHTEPPPPLPPLMQLMDTWVMRPLAWLAGALISAVLLAVCAAWALRSFAPEWLAALVGGA